MGDLLNAVSMPYVFPHEGLFVLGVSVVIVGLLVVRVALARRLRHKDSAER